MGGRSPRPKGSRPKQQLNQHQTTSSHSLSTTLMCDPRCSTILLLSSMTHWVMEDTRRIVEHRTTRYSCIDDPPHCSQHRHIPGHQLLYRSFRPGPAGPRSAPRLSPAGPRSAPRLSIILEKRATWPVLCRRCSCSHWICNEPTGGPRRWWIFRPPLLRRDRGSDLGRSVAPRVRRETGSEEQAGEEVEVLFDKVFHKRWTSRGPPLLVSGAGGIARQDVRRPRRRGSGARAANVLVRSC